MPLSDVRVHDKIFAQADFMDMDNFDFCLDKKHFKSFPYPITYNYNSKGFRDKEWPVTDKELKESVWCFGDSFTVGLGSPIQHTWHRVLAKKINANCINVSLNGASNFWISRQVRSVLTYIKPKIIVIHWSYWHRTENKNSGLPDGYEQKHYELTQLEESLLTNNFLWCIDNVEKNNINTKIIHSFIPFWNYPLKNLYKDWSNIKGADWPKYAPKTVDGYLYLQDYVKNELYNFGFSEENNINFLKIQEKLNQVIYIPEFPVLDQARDGHHYDIKTADYFSNLLIDKFKFISSSTAI